LAFRRLILIIALLSLVCPVFARTAQPLRLSPILQIWNLEEQKLELLFNIVNETDRPIDFSYIVHFNSRVGSGWKNQPTTTIGANRSQLIRISYKPDFLRVGDFISTAVVLYGKDYETFQDMAEQYFEVVDVLKSQATKKLHIEFSEVFPGNQQVRISLRSMMLVADELVRKAGKTGAASGRIRRSPGEREPRRETAVLQLLSSTPAANAGEIPVDGSVATRFSEPLEQGTVSHDTLFLITASGRDKNRKVPGRISVDRSTVVFKPVNNLLPDTQYQVVLSNHIRSTAGTHLARTETWKFTTKKKVSEAKLFGPEKDYLKVLMVTPRVKGVNILTDTTVQLRLSGRIRPETVTEKSFYLSWTGGSVKSERTVLDDQISLKPLAELEPDTVYTVMATPDIRDVTDKNLKKNVMWQFKTREHIRYPEADDPNILVFSSSHEPISWVRERKGVLKIGITAFSPLLHADVNGRRVDIPQDTQAEFDIPYQLRAPSTTFEVTTFTAAGKASKKFVIHFGIKPKPRKPPFQLIAILSSTQTDNLKNARETDDKVSATKAALTIVPQLELKVREPSLLRFKGIVLREKYADEENQNLETSYSQFAVEWEERKTFLGTVTAGVGWNFIRMNNSDFIGENEISEETFFTGEIKNQVSKTGDWTCGLEYKNKNAAAEAADIDNETDAREITLSGSAGFELGPFKNRAKVSAAGNDAIGKYQDYKTATADYSLSVQLGDLTPSLGYSFKHKQMDIYNPSEAAKPEYSSGTASLKLKYKLFQKTSLTVEVKSKNQNSNLAGSTYTTNTATLSLIQIF